MEDEDEVGGYLPLSECHAALIHPYPWDASDRLLSALRDGEVASIAERSSIFSGGQVATHDGHGVPLWVWRDAIKAKVDFSGSALEVNEQGGDRRVKLRGIKCDAADFRAIFGEALASPPTSARQREVGQTASDVGGKPMSDKGGAPTDAVKWSNLVAVVGAIFANADLVPGGGRPKRAALRNTIEDYAARVGLSIASKGTIDPAIDLLIKIAWADHDGGQPLMAADGQPLKIDSNLER